MSVITFSVTSEPMNTAFVSAGPGPTYPAPNPPTPPVVSLEDQLTSGELGAQVQGAQQNYIIWKDAGKETTRSRWPMNSATAVADGIAEIQTAMAAGTDIVLDADGNVVP